jgi:glutamyl-Q tRNA(Asp) synthetase
MSAGFVTRFAPSPTGLLHLGHGYSALLAYDLAKARGGRFLLRFEDIDPGRVRAEYYTAIEQDLRWLGIDWEVPPLRQTERLEFYQQALDTLKARDLVYPCFCTRKEIAAEIAASAAAPHGITGPLYPGTCRALPAAERDRRCLNEAHSWRLDMARATALAGPLHWTDSRAGTVTAEPLAQGDIIVARKDAPTSYHLAATVDDGAQGITDVVRGDDLFVSTHVQRLLQHLLDLPVPAYHHHALICDDQGKRLAKRDAARALSTLREQGMPAADVLAALRATPPDIRRLSVAVRDA